MFTFRVFDVVKQEYMIYHMLIDALVENDEETLIEYQDDNGDWRPVSDFEKTETAYKFGL